MRSTKTGSLWLMTARTETIEFGGVIFFCMKNRASALAQPRRLLLVRVQPSSCSHVAECGWCCMNWFVSGFEVVVHRNILWKIAILFTHETASLHHAPTQHSSAGNCHH